MLMTWREFHIQEQVGVTLIHVQLYLYAWSSPRWSEDGTKWHGLDPACSSGSSTSCALAVSTVDCPLPPDFSVDFAEDASPRPSIPLIWAAEKLT